MKISVQSAPILDIYGIDEGFRMIAEAGIDGVDFNINHCLPGDAIRNHRNEGFFSQTDEEILAQLEPYRLAAEKYGVCFSQAHAPFPSYVADSPETNAYVRMAIEKCMMMCERIDCPWLVAHPAFLGYGERLDAEAEYKLNIDFYGSFLRAIRKTGVRIATENMFSRSNGRVIESCMSDVPTACRLIDELNDMAGEELYGYCFDTGHAALLKRNQYNMITGLGRRIKVLHVHDNDTVSDEHLFPYNGSIDWDAVCSGLKDAGYRGDFSFETFNGLRTWDRSLAPQLLSLLAATGRLFVSRIEG